MSDDLDLIVLGAGAGVGGLNMLYQARQCRQRALVFEAGSGWAACGIGTALRRALDNCTEMRWVTELAPITEAFTGLTDPVGL